MNSFQFVRDLELYIMRVYQMYFLFSVKRDSIC